MRRIAKTEIGHLRRARALSSSPGETVTRPNMADDLFYDVQPSLLYVFCNSHRSEVNRRDRDIVRYNIILYLGIS